MTKTCRKCGIEQPYEAFYRKADAKSSGWRGADGVVRCSHCKSCTKQRTAEWRITGNTRAWKDEQNRKASAKRARIRDAAFAAYGGYRCVCCGETEKAFLTLDHVNNDGAAFRRQALGARNRAGQSTYRWLARQGFPDVGLQVLCMNCQFGKRMNDGVCPHQAQGRSNDYPLVGVGASAPKRIATSQLRLIG